MLPKSRPFVRPPDRRDRALNGRLDTRVRQGQSVRNRGLEVEMDDGNSGDQDLLEQAKAALRDKDPDRAAPILAEIAKRGAANAKAKVANDAV